MADQPASSLPGGAAKSQKSSGAKKSLPPNVQGSVRGVLRVEALRGPGPVHLLWWGETEWTRLVPGNVLTDNNLADNASTIGRSLIEIPIQTNAAKFIRKNASVTSSLLWHGLLAGPKPTGKVAQF